MLQRENNSFAIKFGRLFNSHGEFDDGYLLIRNGIIDGIYNKNYRNYDLLDYSGKIVVPGFIDIHTHGYYGIDAMDSSEASIHYWAGKIMEHGVTSFIPTGVSAPFDKIKNFLKKINNVMNNYNYNESRILGARLEGPYISINKKGAHNKNFIREINMEEINNIAGNYNNTLKIIDMAPELYQFDDAFSVLSRANIIVSAGHTDADFLTSFHAFKIGVGLITHFYNAMSPFNHRNPGMVGAGFLSKNVFIELICDLHHVSGEAIKILANQVGLSRLIMVTDSLSIGDSGKIYGVLGDMNIELKDSVAWISGTNTIAGSILTPDKALRNLVSIGIRPVNAIPSLTSIPANLLGLSDIGDIIPGKKADLCILDNNFNVDSTIIDGKILYSK